MRKLIKTHTSFTRSPEGWGVPAASEIPQSSSPIDVGLTRYAFDELE